MTLGTVKDTGTPQFTIGGDPEFGVVTTKGAPISMIPVIQGTKTMPDILPNEGGIQHDNVAAEFNIPPATCAASFVLNTQETMKFAIEYINMMAPGTLAAKAASMHYPESELDCDEAREFGCDPDYNAWSNKRNKVIDCAADGSLRSFGGHITLGLTDEDNFLNSAVGVRHTIQLMDCFHGVVSVLLDTTPGSVERRELYGKAGAYRRPKFGLEYRSLSNYWIFDERLILLQYKLSETVLRLMRERQHAPIINELVDLSPEKAINEDNKDLAIEILKVLKCRLDDETITLLSELGVDI